MDILIRSKEIKQSGTRLTLRRRGLAYFARLNMSYLNALLMQVKLTETALKSMDKSAVTSATRALYRANSDFRAVLSQFIEGEMPADIDETALYIEVFRFNQPQVHRHETDNGKKITLSADYIEELLENTENNFLATVARLVHATGWTLHTIYENVDNVTAFYLLHNFRALRAESVSDTAVAMRGDDIADYVRKIQGGNY